MSLPRIPAAVVSLGAALGRADTKEELETLFVTLGCDSYRGVSRTYLLRIYQQKCGNIDRHAQNLRLARAI